MPWRIPVIAAARKRSVRSSRWSVVRTNSSCPSVRGWKASATSSGTASAPSSGEPSDPAVGTRDPGLPGSAEMRAPEREPVTRVRVPGQPELGQPGHRLRPGRRLDLGRGQQVGERVEVVADADPALGAGLEGCRAAPGERVEDDVARPRVARDEGVGQGGREAREVRAHRVEGVAPQALLVLPLGREGDRRQLERKLEGELARGRETRRTCRHGRSQSSLSSAPIPVGASGRGV